MIAWLMRARRMGVDRRPTLWRDGIGASGGKTGRGLLASPVGLRTWFQNTCGEGYADRNVEGVRESCTACHSGMMR